MNRCSKDNPKKKTLTKTLYLKYEKITSFDKNSEGLERTIILVPRDNFPIDTILAGSGRRDGPSELELLGHIIAGAGAAETVYETDKGLATLLLLLLVVEGVDEVLELGAAEVAGADAEDEANGVHEVGLAGAVGPDDGGEVEEGADGLVALVGLEVLQLQADDLAARRGRRGEGRRRHRPPARIWEGK